MEMLLAGWDGGGTGTTVVCMNPDGAVLARKRFGPLNLNGAETGAVARTVRDCLSWMGGYGECVSLCVGAAGVSNANAAALLRRMLEQSGYGGRLTLAGDHEIALHGAVGGVGAVVIAGTGSICCGRDAQGQTARAGGGGHLIDDGGSGYAIGRDVLSAVLRARDGRGPTTLLENAVAEELGGASRESIVSYVYQEKRQKADIARFARLLAPASEAGDAAAQEIAGRAAQELYALLAAVLARLELPSADVALMGSVLEKCAPVRARTEKLIGAGLPAARVIAPRADAAQGAAMIAKQRWEEQCHGGYAG